MTWYPPQQSQYPVQGQYPPGQYPATNPNPYAQQTPWPPGVKPRNQSYKTLAIILFVVGFCLHILGLVPFIGIIFGLLGLVADNLAFVFLCLL